MHDCTFKSYDGLSDSKNVSGQCSLRCRVAGTWCVYARFRKKCIIYIGSGHILTYCEHKFDNATESIFFFFWVKNVRSSTL